MGDIQPEHMTVADMTSERRPTDVYTSHDVQRFYMTLGYNEVGNPRFLDPVHYSLSSMTSMHTGTHGNHLFALQMNYITFKMPMSPVLSQFGDLGEVQSFFKNKLMSLKCIFREFIVGTLF